MKKLRVRSRELGVIILIGLFAVSATFVSGQTNKVYETPVKILHKSRALYPKHEKGTTCVQGTVTLRVEFLESAEIGKIVVVSGFPEGFEEFNECAIMAAKNIKFKPAMKDGKSVTVTKQVQYSFSLY